MYRYAITFTTDSLDEVALRDILEDRFRVYDCAVSRSKVGQVPTAEKSLTYLPPQERSHGGAPSAPHVAIRGRCSGQP